MDYDNLRPRSSAWYIFPIFLGFIGGLIMFFALKSDHRDRAIKGLILGIVITIIVFMIPFILWIVFSIAIDPPFHMEEEFTI